MRVETARRGSERSGMVQNGMEGFNIASEWRYHHPELKLRTLWRKCSGKNIRDISVEMCWKHLTKSEWDGVKGEQRTAPALRRATDGEILASTERAVVVTCQTRCAHECLDNYFDFLDKQWNVQNFHCILRFFSHNRTSAVCIDTSWVI